MSDYNNPDNTCSVVLSDGQLLDYLKKIREKTCDYKEIKIPELFDETKLQSRIRIIF